jgi:hypothetical protein
MDMADCPEWIYTGTRINTVLFNPRVEPVEWTPVAYKFSDSPMFPILARKNSDRSADPMDDGMNEAK